MRSLVLELGISFPLSTSWRGGQGERYIAERGWAEN